jgi:hypothetical protein
LIHHDEWVENAFGNPGEGTANGKPFTFVAGRGSRESEKGAIAGIERWRIEAGESEGVCGDGGHFGNLS